MVEKKNSAFARVHISYDGRVQKWFLGPQAKARYENEVRVLEYLASKDCNFVPRLLEKDAIEFKITTTNCGHKVEYLSNKKCNALFDELEKYGVRHKDQALRNITYSAQIGRFCLIDFEFASILEKGFDAGPEPFFNPNLDA